jgi:hypothetical protein
MSLLDFFKKKHEEEVKKIELYCQNPQCENPLITEEVAEVNGALVHLSEGCIEMYMLQKTLGSGKPSIFSRIHYMPYSTAEFLAREGKVEYSRLETKTGESQ